MRFVKFNYNTGETFSFCLDDLSIFESSGKRTQITLRIGHTITLPIETESFVDQVFSDEHGHNEYQLIVIEEEDWIIDPETVAGAS